MIKPTIKNLASVPIDICKASTNVQTIPPGIEIPFLTTVKAFCHGHSSIGSFIIARCGKRNFDFTCWGNIELRLIITNNSCAFEIIEKN